MKKTMTLTGENLKNIVMTVLFSAILIGICLWVFLKPADKISISERRALAQIPVFSLLSINDGSYFEKMETFLLDQFPHRDDFLRAKAINQFYLFGQKDNHNIFIKDGTAVAITYPFKEEAAKLAVKKIMKVNETYFSKMNIYVSIIPDKAYLLAEQNGYPVIDYIKICEILRSGIYNAKYIDIFDTLDANDYFRTDSHWKQDSLLPTAEHLLTYMGWDKSLTDEYTAHELYPFYGVYYGQSALPIAPDKLTYLTNSLLDDAIVYRASENAAGFEKASMYTPDMISTNDPFDLFLGGACTVTILENTHYTSQEKELYLFSDSYGCSIAPLLLHGYSRVYLIDIRYIRSSKLREIIDFKTGSDVLYLYSIQTLATSSSLNTD